MKTRPILLFLLAAVATTLPGCRSLIGDRIRNSAQLCIDADTNERYRCGEEVLVPEYSYRYSEPLITSEYYADLYSVSELKRTGSYRVLGADGHSLGERRPGDSPGIVKETPMSLSHYQPMGRTRETQPEPGYTLAAIAAAPFDYAIDPALSIILTPPYLLLRACGLNGLVDWVHY